MCEICRSFSSGEVSPDQALRMAGLAIERDPAQADHFDALISNISGVSMPDRDEDAEATYEARRQGQE